MLRPRRAVCPAKAHLSLCTGVLSINISSHQALGVGRTPSPSERRDSWPCERACITRRPRAGAWLSVSRSAEWGVRDIHVSGARCLHALARAFPQLDVRDEREVSQHGSTIERIACWGARTARAEVRLIVVAILGWVLRNAVGYSPARAAVLPMPVYFSSAHVEGSVSKYVHPTHHHPPARAPLMGTWRR